MGNCLDSNSTKVKQGTVDVASKMSDASFSSQSPRKVSFLRQGKEWVEVVDEETRHVYYVCEETGEQRLILPDDIDDSRV